MATEKQIIQIATLQTTMDYIKEKMDGMSTNLQNHINAEDIQIDRMETMIKDWMKDFDAKQSVKDSEYESKFLKKETVKVFMLTLV